MANGTIHHNDQMRYAVKGQYTPNASTTLDNGTVISSPFLLPYPQSQKQTQYLHNDGQWHHSPQHDTDNNLWPGYFHTQEEALQALANAPEPNTYQLHEMTPCCPVCHTLAPEGLDNHTHYPPGLRMAEVLKSMSKKD